MTDLTREMYQQERSTYWFPLRPHKDQSSLWRDNRRFICAACGRGSGKTVVASRKIVLATQRDPGSYAYTLPTIAQAKRVAWDTLKNLALYMHPDKKGALVAKVHETDMTISFRNGSLLYVFGMDQPRRAEGKQYKGVVIDESSDTKPDVFTRTFLPALTAFEGWCWRIGVPKFDGVGGPTFQRDWKDWQTNSAHGSYWWPSSTVVSAEQLETFREIMDPETFQEQFEASWARSGGGVFYCFDSTLNRPPESSIWDIDSTAPSENTETLRVAIENRGGKIVVGMDFNVDPMSWVIGVLVDDRLSIFDEVWARHTHTASALELLCSRLQKWGLDPLALGPQLVVCGDAASKARHTNASTTDYLLIKNHPQFQNAAILFPSSNPAVRDRVAVTNTSLCTATGTRHLFISPRCTKLIEDLQARSYKDGTRDIDDSSWGVGHMTDALGYAVWHTIGLSAIRANKKEQSATTTTGGPRFPTKVGASGMLGRGLTSVSSTASASASKGSRAGLSNLLKGK